MSTATLSVDLKALSENWRALNAMSACETGAVVKADGYGLGAGQVATQLAKVGARTFFVAVAEEGAKVREALGPTPQIFVFSGHMHADTSMLQHADLTPLVNSGDQLRRHLAALPGHAFGVQLDSGMNRLGIEPAEWQDLRQGALAHHPVLAISHLACADDPEHAMNAAQLKCFRDMTDDLAVPRSLAATGGILLGPDYHFDLTRPGIGLYGGAPFQDSHPVVTLSLPVIQIRVVEKGETVGYGNKWAAIRPSRIATVSAGYADGLIRAMGPHLSLHAGPIACPLVGRISMDLITVDVTNLTNPPESLEMLNTQQTVETLAEAAGTISYEILTSLGTRYTRVYTRQ
ncbi:MAG: alanine racemase [Paracoccaceae bacterium]|nr:alanine racemase [Paracoccaceae bacterium]